MFPAAKLINDRFHVQQLMSEAVDQLRIRYRWKVLDAENQAIRKHRQKKKEAKSKAERERIGKWEPERMENGETLPDRLHVQQLMSEAVDQLRIHDRW